MSNVFSPSSPNANALLRRLKAMKKENHHETRNHHLDDLFRRLTRDNPDLAPERISEIIENGFRPYARLLINEASISTGALLTHRDNRRALKVRMRNRR